MHIKSTRMLLAGVFEPKNFVFFKPEKQWLTEFLRSKKYKNIKEKINTKDNRLTLWFHPGLISLECSGKPRKCAQVME